MRKIIFCACALVLILINLPIQLTAKSITVEELSPNPYSTTAHYFGLYFANIQQLAPQEIARIMSIELGKMYSYGDNCLWMLTVNGDTIAVLFMCPGTYEEADANMWNFGWYMVSLMRASVGPNAIWTSEYLGTN